MSQPLSKSHGRKVMRPSVQPRDLMAQDPELARAWRAQIITLFPDAFPGLLGQSLTGKALKDGIWQLNVTDLRRFGEGKHRNVDDTPAGGGAGMVLRADIMGRAIDAARSAMPKAAPLIYMSPRGVPLRQDMAADLAKRPGATVICGRFEGLDQRVIDHYNITEISIGDYVLTGGELAAQVLLDATVRLLPGVLGNAQSAVEESFSDGLLEHPHYTRPAEWNGHDIPDVLLSGHHGDIAKWRRAQAEAITRDRRPDLWDARSKPDE